MAKKNELGETLDHTYGNDKWWQATISTYDELRGVLAKQGLEQHHLVPAAYLRKGPPSTRMLATRVPSITLSRREHQKTLHGRDWSNADTLNGYLALNGLSLNKGSFTHDEILKAIDLCSQFYRTMGIDHFADACREFRSVYRTLCTIVGEKDEQ